MVADGGAVARPRVAAAARPGLALGHGRAAEDVGARGEHGRRGREREVAGRRVDGREADALGEERRQVAVEAQLARHVGPAQPELVGLVEEVGERAAADPDAPGGPARRGGREHRPVPQLDVDRQVGEPAAGDAAQDRGQAGGGGRGGADGAQDGHRLPSTR